MTKEGLGQALGIRVYWKVPLLGMGRTQRHRLEMGLVMQKVKQTEEVVGKAGGSI